MKKSPEPDGNKHSSLDLLLIKVNLICRCHFQIYKLRNFEPHLTIHYTR
jgi:hypothetical protein